MNTLTQYFVPEWIGVLFLTVIFIPTIMIGLMVKKAAPAGSKSNVFYAIIGFFALYFTYVTIASFNDMFVKVFLPPIVLLYCTFPLAVFLFTVVINLKIYKILLENLKLEDLVRVHIFRLIGVFFVLLAYQKALPGFFALVAGFGDIITAITSVFVVNAISNKKPFAKKLTFIWNVFGFIDILFTAVTAIVLTKISIDTGAMGVDTLAQFPFCFIPAFAPPVIIFLHIAIFKKIRSV